jgi:hypothetical protein
VGARGVFSIEALQANPGGLANLATAIVDASS